MWFYILFRDTDDDDNDVVADADAILLRGGALLHPRGRTQLICHEPLNILRFLYAAFGGGQYFA